MTRFWKTCAQLASIAVLATGVLAGTGEAARADVPPGWVPGPNSYEADFGDATWVHHGFYAGRAGNVHTGWVNVEEDDDVLTAELIDWKCPAGAEPPAPGTGTAGAGACKVKRYQWVSYIQYYDVATFNQKRDRLRLSGDFAAVDQNDQPAGTVSFNLYLEGVGAPTVSSTVTEGTLHHEESWSEARLFGKIDGHGLAGRNTTQLSGQVSFYVEGYVPA
jgi:hypothetical protein